MSPASSGPLEVERYIGACLISSHSRNKSQNQKTRDVYYPHPDLYQNSNYMLDARYHHPRRCNSDGWAGGMPLISFANQRRPRREESVSPRVEEVPLSRLAVHTQGLPLILSRQNRRTKQRAPVPANPGIDTLSVASDESSGSNVSETSLPRIIKPRKRRKKDRKPRQVVEEPQKPFPYCFVYPPRISDVRELSDEKSDLLSETPQLHHKFEDVMISGTDSGEPVSSCQCRYCDPAGQIWDVDRHCYSPFLTTPTSHIRQTDTETTTKETKKQPLSDRISNALKNQCLISTFSLKIDEDKERCTPNRTQQSLEISTKIVTSPNGHRDLEIRLFSSPIDDRIKIKTDTNKKINDVFEPEE